MDQPSRYPSGVACNPEDREIPPEGAEHLSAAAHGLAAALQALKDAEEAIRAADELGRFRDPRVRPIMQHVDRALAELRALRSAEEPAG